MQNKDGQQNDAIHHASQDSSSMDAAPIVDSTPTVPVAENNSRKAHANATNGMNATSATNTKPKTTNAVTATHIVTTESVQAEEVPTLPLGSLETIRRLQPEITLRSATSGRPVNVPSPLVHQPADYHRDVGEWMQVWWDGIRPLYLLLSIVPVCVGSVLAWTRTIEPHKILGHFHLTHFIGMLLAVVLIQSGAHLINDYYDYLYGVDIGNPLSSGGLIQQGIVKPTRVLNVGLSAIGIGFVIGVVIALAGGPLVFLLGACGLLAAYFYSATKRSLSSLALGDVVAFFIFGPFITLGAYLVMLQTGQIDRSVIAYGTILGLFAAAVIHVNNMRDIEGDDAAGKRTLANILGLPLSRVIYDVLILLPYVLILGMALPHGAPHFLLLALWTLPMLVVVLTGIARAGVPASLNLVVRQTLRLETYFALLLIIALLITAFLPVLPHLPTHIPI